MYVWTLLTLKADDVGIDPEKEVMLRFVSRHLYRDILSADYHWDCHPFILRTSSPISRASVYCSQVMWSCVVVCSMSFDVVLILGSAYLVS